MDSYSWLLYLLAIALVFFAQNRVQAAYRKYSQIPTRRRVTGEVVAQEILAQNNIANVHIVMTDKPLSDHYDPRKNVVALSPEVYNGVSIAAVCIAAHEIGHVLQHYAGYKMLAMRNRLLPFALVAGNLSWGIIVVSLFSPFFRALLWIGVIMIFIGVVLFQFMTLPVEFDASNRALAILDENNYLAVDELAGAQKMLRAAAFTYIAAFLNTLIQVLRIVLLSNRRKN